MQDTSPRRMWVCQEIVRRLRETFPELEVTKSAVHGDAVKFYMR